MPGRSSSSRPRPGRRGRARACRSRGPATDGRRRPAGLSTTRRCSSSHAIQSGTSSRLELGGRAAPEPSARAARRPRAGATSAVAARPRRQRPPPAAARLRHAEPTSGSEARNDRAARPRPRRGRRLSAGSRLADQQRDEQDRHADDDEAVREVEGRPVAQVEEVGHVPEPDPVDQVRGRAADQRGRARPAAPGAAPRAREVDEHPADCERRQRRHDWRCAREEPERDARVLDVVDREGPDHVQRLVEARAASRRSASSAGRPRSPRAPPRRGRPTGARAPPASARRPRPASTRPCWSRRATSTGPRRADSLKCAPLAACSRCTLSSTAPPRAARRGSARRSWCRCRRCRRRSASAPASIAVEHPLLVVLERGVELAVVGRGRASSARWLSLIGSPACSSSSRPWFVLLQVLERVLRPLALLEQPLAEVFEVECGRSRGALASLALALGAIDAFQASYDLIAGRRGRRRARRARRGSSSVPATAGRAPPRWRVHAPAAAATRTFHASPCRPTSSVRRAPGETRSRTRVEGLAMRPSIGSADGAQAACASASASSTASSAASSSAHLARLSEQTLPLRRSGSRVTARASACASLEHAARPRACAWSLQLVRRLLGGDERRPQQRLEVAVARRARPRGARSGRRSRRAGARPPRTSRRSRRAARRRARGGSRAARA